MGIQVLKFGDDGTVFGSPALIGLSLTNPTLSGATISSGLIGGTTQINFSSTAYTADGAITIASGVSLLSKAGSAGAFTLAAPGAIGYRITLTTLTDFAHVVTFTGGTLWDGTAGANTTWTAAAVQGSSLTVVSVSATKWNVESFNLGTIAP